MVTFIFNHCHRDFFGRSSQVSIFSSENPVKAVAISIAASLGMFNVLGDLNWRHNFSGSPQLFWPVSILFLLGLGISIKRFGSSEKFLLAWLFIFLLPNILTTEGNPHALRSLGAMPAVMIFAGSGLVWIYKKFQNYFNENLKKQILLFLIIFLVFVANGEYNKYFVRWASNIKTVEAFSQNQIEIANYLNGLPSNIEKYVVWPSNDRPTNNDLPVSAQTVYFLTYGKSNTKYLKSDNLDKIKTGSKGMVVVPLYFDLELLHNLNKRLQNNKVEFIYLNTPILIVP